MKIKNFLMAALLMAASAPVMAQTTIDDAVKVIKSNASVKEKEAAAKDALKAYKKDAKAWATIGRAYMAAKDLEKAAFYAEGAIKANKKSAEGYILRGDLKVLNDEPGAAAAEYQNAIYFDPQNTEGYRKYAYIYRGSDPDQSVEMIDKIKDIDPSYPADAEAGHIFYMVAKNKGGDYMQKALARYQKTNKATLENAYLTEYALIAFASQKNDLSKELAEYGLTKNPRNAGYNRLAMYNSVELKEYDAAVKYIDRLFNQSDSVEVTANDYKYAALASVGAKDYPAAVHYYKQQLGLAEGNDAQAAIYKELSNAYKLNNEFDESLKAYQTYLDMSGNATANDYAGLANIYRNSTAVQSAEEQLVSINKAIQVYKDMIVKFPTSADYANFMAARTIQATDPDQKNGAAVPFYQALFDSISAAGIKDNTDKTRISEACQYLGIYYFKIKDDAAMAKPYFEKLQEIDPENALAKQVLETYK